MLDRFLIADDSPAVCEVLREILTMRGVREENMRFVDRGDQVLQAYEAMEPDLTFLDINMEGAQGDEIAKALLHQHPKALIVGITGLMPSDDQVRNMISWGVFDVIHKPIRKRKVDELFNLVREERSGLGRVM